MLLLELLWPLLLQHLLPLAPLLLPPLLMVLPLLPLAPLLLQLLPQ